MVVIVLGRARHTAKIRAKSLIGQKKIVVILAHYAVKRQFLVYFCTVYMLTVNFLLEIAVESKQSLAPCWID
jgi:hypothetical protein